jgi:hypothetical protein
MFERRQVRVSAGARTSVVDTLGCLYLNSNHFFPYPLKFILIFILMTLCSIEPVTVAERSKACIVFARSEPGSWVRIPHSGHGCLMCVCAFFCVCVVLCLCRGLATSWSPVQGVLPSVNNQETEKSALCSEVGARRRTNSGIWRHALRSKISDKFACVPNPTLWRRIGGV